MGKNAKKKTPFVSVCTPTFNRRPFIPTMFECFRNQNYPKSQIEWIIVDDGTDKIEDLVKMSGIEQIKYFALDQKLTLGAKRNFMHEKTRGSIIVYMDDDDYYPPDRISHAVETLLKTPWALCAGSSEIYVYFKHIQKMIQFGPYGPNHATAGTFAFRRELLAKTRYDETATFAEERVFLKNYTIPFVQLDPLKSILVFSHNHNTFDKRTLLETSPNRFMRESEKMIDAFIRLDAEQGIKRFFMEEIDGLLENYEPGEPKMKPDVMKQLKEVDEQRKAQLQIQQRRQHIIEKPGEAPRLMTADEIADALYAQKKLNGLLLDRVKILDNLVQDQRKQISDT